MNLSRKKPKIIWLPTEIRHGKGEKFCFSGRPESWCYSNTKRISKLKLMSKEINASSTISV